MPFWKKSFSKGAGQSCGNGNHCQRPGENINGQQLGRASRAGRHRRRDAHPYGAG